MGGPGEGGHHPPPIHTHTHPPTHNPPHNHPLPQPPPTTTPQLTDHMTTHPPVPHFCFWHTCATGAVHPCTRDCRLVLQHMIGVTELRMGRAWDRHKQTPQSTGDPSRKSAKRTNGRPTVFYFQKKKKKRNGCAKPLDWRDLQQCGGRRCVRTPAVWSKLAAVPASPSRSRATTAD